MHKHNNNDALHRRQTQSYSAKTARTPLENHTIATAASNLPKGNVLPQKNTAHYVSNDTNKNCHSLTGAKSEKSVRFFDFWCARADFSFGENKKIKIVLKRASLCRKNKWVINIFHPLPHHYFLSPASPQAQQCPSTSTNYLWKEGKENVMQWRMVRWVQ